MCHRTGCYLRFQASAVLEGIPHRQFHSYREEKVLETARQCGEHYPTTHLKVAEKVHFMLHIFIRRRMVEEGGREAGTEGSGLERCKPLALKTQEGARSQGM